MAANYDIGPRVGIEGEKTFETSIRSIQANVKNLGSQMKLLTAEFDGSADGMEALVAKNDLLKKTVEATQQQVGLLQKEYDKQVRTLANLEGALNKAAKEYGANSKEAAQAQNAYNRQAIELQKLETRMNEAKTSMAKLTREISDNENAMDELRSTSGKMDKVFGFVGTAAKNMLGLKRNTDEVSDSMSKAHKNSLSFGDVVKGIVTSEAILGGFRMIGSAIADMGRSMVDFAKQGVAVASDLQEVQNVVDVTFGTQGAAVIEDFAKSAAGSFGMSALSAKQFTGTMGAMLKSMNLSDSEVLDMSTALTGLAGDMASFYNLDAEEAFAKLRSGISGETEPLKQLGINMSVANLEAYALTQGINTAWKEMTQAEQATLRYQYIMQATADAQGDFARTSDSYANQQRILQLNLENLSATIGSKVLPGLNSFTGIFNDLLSGNIGLDGFGARIGVEIGNVLASFSANLPAFMEAGGQLVGSLVSGISSALPGVLAAGQTILEKLGSEIIAQLPIAIDWGFAAITNFASGIVSAIPLIAEKAPLAIESFLITVGNYGNEILSKGSEILSNFAAGIISEIPGLVAKLPEIISSITRFFTENFPKIGKIGLELVLKLGTSIVAAIPQLVGQLPAVGKAINDAIRAIIPALISTGKDLVKGLWTGVKSWIGQLLSNLRGMVSDIVSTVKSSLGIHSPSRVFAEIGEYSAEGLGVGFADKIGSVSKRIQRDVAGIVPTVDSRVAVSGGANVSNSDTAGGGLTAGALREALSGMGVYMDGRKVGRLVSTSQSNTARAMGV